MDGGGGAFILFYFLEPSKELCRGCVTIQRTNLWCGTQQRWKNVVSLLVSIFPLTSPKEKIHSDVRFQTEQYNFFSCSTQFDYYENECRELVPTATNLIMGNLSDLILFFVGRHCFLLLCRCARLCGRRGIVFISSPNFNKKPQIEEKLSDTLEAVENQK